ncbi:hypothetical protein [Endozoicomonas sp. ONNA2]|uniref:hypothetical protein n=1 Tax=Endozoicomonas sp. ONNA2 TaxID=2828741 RepID=UPI00214980F0|nr:hypothetical protein [Endozoicomonas sp. ONNA2]
MEPATMHQVGGSLIRASSETFGIYTEDEKKAALGRHAVNKLDVSNTYPALAGLADIAGTTLSTMTRLGDFPLQPVALAGATMGLLTALANARPPTPLEHASYQLEQTRADEAYLLEHPLDSPGYEYNIRDYRMIKHMASRYQESWNSLWLSGADVNSLNPKNVHALMTDIQYELTHKHGIGRDDIIHVGANMGKIKSLEDAKELTKFKELMARLQTPAKDQEDVSRLMFILNRLIEKSVGKSRELPLSELYQDLCKFKYSQYKMRLEQDRFRLEEDVRILQTMERNQPASVSAPPAMGTEV